jgi:GNAT superfamily N-acetyltransferase
MDAAQPELIASDLAPGDTRAVDFDWSGVNRVRVRRADHPLFARAYQRLWDEFGASGGMEERRVIEQRFAWHPAQPVDGHALLYEMVVIESAGEILAVRDHTAILPARSPRDRPVRAVVHLSHLLVEPRRRGSGLAGWMRAFPIQAARACAAAAGESAPAAVTLVAEMEPSDGVTPAVLARLRSYQRAGFAQIDADRVSYCQPDFRAPHLIDATAVRPLPFALIARRVGREDETSLSGAELRELVTALYTMFGATMRADHMEPLWAALERFPAADEMIRLHPPLR